MTDAAARLNYVAWWRGGVAGGGAGEDKPLPVIGWLSSQSADDD
jgi:hypothetical protein